MNDANVLMAMVRVIDEVCTSIGDAELSTAWSSLKEAHVQELLGKMSRSGGGAPDRRRKLDRDLVEFLANNPRIIRNTPYLSAKPVADYVTSVAQIYHEIKRSRELDEAEMAIGAQLGRILILVVEHIGGTMSNGNG